MAKLDLIKEKISASKASAQAKLEKIAFLGWKKKDPNAPAKAESPYSLGSLYRSGGFFDRVRLLMALLLLVAGVLSATYAGKKIWGRLQLKSEDEKLKEAYAKGFSEMSQKALEKATLMSLGKFNAKAVVETKTRMMSVDIWIRMSSPAASDFVRNNEVLVNDQVVESLNEMFRHQVNPLTEEGKYQAKSLLMEALNKKIPEGRIDDIFFQNLVVQ